MPAVTPGAPRLPLRSREARTESRQLCRPFQGGCAGIWGFLKDPKLGSSLDEGLGAGRSEAGLWIRPRSQKQRGEAESLVGLERSPPLAAAFPARIPIKGFILLPSGLKARAIVFPSPAQEPGICGAAFGGEPPANSSWIRLRGEVLPSLPRSGAGSEAGDASRGNN